MAGDERRRMKGSTVTLSIKLEVVTRQEGNAWLAWCIPLDVMAQAATKQAAIESLKEAVQLWFESCIARNVLDEALLEAGFRKTKAGEQPPKSANMVKVHKPLPAHAFSARHEHIEVSIPAYIAAQCNLERACAPR